MVGICLVDGTGNLVSLYPGMVCCLQSHGMLLFYKSLTDERMGRTNGVVSGKSISSVALDEPFMIIQSCQDDAMILNKDGLGWIRHYEQLWNIGCLSLKHF